MYLRSGVKSIFSTVSERDFIQNEKIMVAPMASPIIHPIIIPKRPQPKSTNIIPKLARIRTLNTVIDAAALNRERPYSNPFGIALKNKKKMEMASNWIRKT